MMARNCGGSSGSVASWKAATPQRTAPMTPESRGAAALPAWLASSLVRSAEASFSYRCSTRGVFRTSLVLRSRVLGPCLVPGCAWSLVLGRIRPASAVTRTHHDRGTKDEGRLRTKDEALHRRENCSRKLDSTVWLLRPDRSPGLERERRRQGGSRLV